MRRPWPALGRSATAKKKKNPTWRWLITRAETCRWTKQYKKYTLIKLLFELCVWLYIVYVYNSIQDNRDISPESYKLLSSLTIFDLQLYKVNTQLCIKTSGLHVEDTWIDFLPRTLSLYLNYVFSPSSSKIYSLCVYVGEGGGGVGGRLEPRQLWRIYGRVQESLKCPNFQQIVIRTMSYDVTVNEIMRERD